MPAAYCGGRSWPGGWHKREAIATMPADHQGLGAVGGAVGESPLCFGAAVGCMHACLPAPLVPGTLVVLGVVLGPRPMLGGGSLCLVAGRLLRSINGFCPGGAGRGRLWGGGG